MAWHVFERGDKEAHLWTNVLPGDVVQSYGTLAYRLHQFTGRDEHTDVYMLHSAPILVLSRSPGVPGEDPVGADHDHRTTYTCLSRHGLIVVLQYKE